MKSLIICGKFYAPNKVRSSIQAGTVKVVTRLTVVFPRNAMNAASSFYTVDRLR
ncbi:hypothetical protein [Polaromonas sp.]|uniref:hypothetical protein n=1 Tax=Polaromonas sp. TaxID=1869339 RepID=UPI0025F9E3D5|nr:hypothetical protein [Polaromonas sp.]